MSTKLTTLRELNKCLQTKLLVNINIIAAYFAKEKLPL
jgi:hypothetical protein